MDVEVEGVQFEDDFEINEKDPDGKKFDRGEAQVQSSPPPTPSCCYWWRWWSGRGREGRGDWARCSNRSCVWTPSLDVASVGLISFHFISFRFVSFHRD